MRRGELPVTSIDRRMRAVESMVPTAPTGPLDVRIDGPGQQLHHQPFDVFV